MELSEGVIVGCDNNQEWLLPWFWDSYIRYNNYPVTFMDFGMSAKALAFCRERGAVLSVPPIILQDVPEERSRSWDVSGENGFWSVRPKWFCKPSAFILCPYDRGLWLDLDCKVSGSLQPLFALIDTRDIALVKDPECTQILLQEKGIILPGQVSYNSGVVAFKKGSDPIKLWQREALFYNDRHKGDQDALNYILYINDIKVKELPREYNWLMTLGENPKALISHYLSGGEKNRLLKEMKKELINQVQDLLQSISI